MCNKISVISLTIFDFDFKGSVVVQFTIIKSDAGISTSDAVSDLADLISSGSLNISSINGTILNLDPSSFSYEALDTGMLMYIM